MISGKLYILPSPYLFRCYLNIWRKLSVANVGLKTLLFFPRFSELAPALCVWPHTWPKRASFPGSLREETKKYTITMAGVYGEENNIITSMYGDSFDQQGTATKRKKLDDGSALPITSPDNPHYSPPSKVVHVRSVSEAAREQDIVRAIGEFGRIRFVVSLFMIHNFFQGEG